MGLGVRIRYRSRDGLNGERLVHHLPARLGRNALNECPLVHPFVSSFHASIEMLDGELCVRDLNSRNGLLDRQGVRLPAGQCVPLRVLGGVFVVGGGVEVEVEPLEDHREIGGRSPSSVRGMVLGNAAAMGGQANVPPLPPLSMARPAGAGSTPPPPPYAPAAGPGSMAPSLPSLAHLAHAVQPAPGRPSPGPPPDPADRNRSTQHLSMSMDLLALLGLRELAASLVPGVPLETTGDVARLLTKLHDLVEVLCRCLPPLRDSRLPAGRWGRRQNASKTEVRVLTADDPATLAATLLDWREKAYDGPEAVERILADVVAQQAALLDNVMAGVDALLGELSPERIEQATREDGGVSAVFGRYRALWQTFEERFRQLSNEDRRIELLLGPEAADAIRQRQARPRTS